MEQAIMEKDQKRNNEIGGLGPQLISVEDYDSAEKEMAEDSVSTEMLTAGIFKRKPHQLIGQSSKTLKEILQRLALFIA